MQIYYEKLANLDGVPHRFCAWIVVDHIVWIYPVIIHPFSHDCHRKAEQDHPEHTSTTMVVHIEANYLMFRLIQPGTNLNWWVGRRQCFQRK